jgi:hypothetical protein
MRQPSRVGCCSVIQVQQMLTFAAVGRTFPHDVEQQLCAGGAPSDYCSARNDQRAHALKDAQAQAARHFSPNPRDSPSNLRRHPSARSQSQAFKPACLPACLERGEATGIKASSHAAATTTYSPSVLLYLIPYLLTCCARPVCIIAPPTLVTRTL